MKFLNIEKRIIAELDKTLGSISEKEIELLIESIQKADKVFFFFFLREILSLHAVARRLAHLGIQSVVFW